MADTSMRLSVMLSVMDRALAPLKRIGAGSAEAAKQLKATKERLKELNQQQGTIGDFRKARTGLTDVSAKLQEAQRKVGELARGFSAAGPPTRAMAREMTAAKKEAAQLGQQYDTQRTKVQALRDRLSQAGISTRELSSNERRLRSDIAGTTAEITRQTAQLKAQADTQRKLDVLKSRHAKAMAHAGMVAGTGMAMQMAGRKGVETALKPVQTFASHEDAMLGIARQVPGARNDAGQLTGVYRTAEREIRELSGRIPQTTVQIAEMMTAAARMEVPTAQLWEFTLLASEMATAFDAVPDAVTESMGKVAKNFKIPVTEIRGLADSINYLDDNAISKGADIIDFLIRTSGVVSTVAMTAKDAAALGSTLLTLGERTETASTAANAIVQKMAAADKGTKKFKAAMAEIGLKPMDVQMGMSKDATATIDRVIGAIRKLPESQRIGVMVELVGMEHSDTLAKLVDKPEELTRQRALANGSEAGGSMAREAAARNATLSAQTQMARNRIFNLGASIGESLAPALIQLMDIVNPALEAMTRFVQEHQTLFKWVGLGAMAISGIVVVLGMLLVPFALLAGKVMLLRFVFTRLGMGLGAGGLLGRIAGFIGAVARAAGPFALLGTAAWMVYRNWDDMVGGARLLWEDLTAWLSGLWTGFTTWLGGIWDGLVGIAANIWGRILTTVSNLINGGVSEWIKLLLNFSPFGIIWNAFTSALSMLGIQVPEQFRSFGSFIIDGLIGGITGKLGQLRDTVISVASSAAGWFKEKLGINSPSRVFTQYGGWISEGAAIGIQRGQPDVRAAALALAAAAAAPVAMGQGIDMLDAGAVQFDRRPALSAQPTAVPMMGGSQISITIHAAPGMDLQELARAVAQEVDRRDRAQRTRSLSRLHDMD